MAVLSICIMSTICSNIVKLKHYILQAILQISLKTTSILEDLHLIRESLVSDTSWLSSGKSIPLLPPLKIYLCHIQQIELGSPMGNNGLIKWTKCRLIVLLLDSF